MSATALRSPVRQLYDSLCTLMGAEDLHANLNTLDGYRALEGDPEPRFCEWAYEALSRRALAADLQRCVLRPTDIAKLACVLNAKPSSFASHDVVLRQTLASIGIREPEIPPELPDGISVLKRFCKWADSELSGMPIEQLEPDEFSRNPVPACRRAIERLLKVIAVFLHDGGLDSLLLDIWTAGQHGFAARERVADLPGELVKLELGPLNYLLHAASGAVDERGMRIAFLSRATKLWDASVFASVSALGDALNATVHDSGRRTTEAPRDLLSRQRKAVGHVLQKIETKKIRVPRLVQFFRRYTDGHAVHFEGFSDEGQLVRCFETSEYELHQPYLLCAATNPISVDIVCVPLRDWFRRAV